MHYPSRIGRTNARADPPAPSRHFGSVAALPLALFGHSHQYSRLGHVQAVVTLPFLHIGSEIWQYRFPRHWVFWTAWVSGDAFTTFPVGRCEFPQCYLAARWAGISGRILHPPIRERV